MLEYVRDLDELVEKGHCYYAEGDYLKAIECYQTAADSGYPRAWAGLARVYEEGKDEDKDGAEATIPAEQARSTREAKVKALIADIELSIQEGDCDLLKICAPLLLLSPPTPQGPALKKTNEIRAKDKTLSLPLFADPTKDSLILIDTEKQQALYFFDHSTQNLRKIERTRENRSDYEKLLFRLQKVEEKLSACDEELSLISALTGRKSGAVGLASLGELHEQGIYFAKDKQKAYHLYRAAAKRGNAFAQTKIGLRAYRGLRPLQVREKAKDLLLMAANQGYIKAYALIAHIYYNEILQRPEPDFSLPIEYSKRSQELEDFKSLFWPLGSFYLHGYAGLKKNINQATRAYLTASTQLKLEPEIRAGIKDGLKAVLQVKELDPALIPEVKRTLDLLMTAKEREEEQRQKEHLRTLEEKRETYLEKLHLKKKALQGTQDLKTLRAIFLMGELLLLEPQEGMGEVVYEYLRCAAFNKHGNALCLLGLLYEYGLCGLPSNPASALELYKLARNPETISTPPNLSYLILGTQILLADENWEEKPWLKAWGCFEKFKNEEDEYKQASLERINQGLINFFTVMATKFSSAQLLLTIVYQGQLLGAKISNQELEFFFQAIKNNNNPLLHYNLGKLFEEGYWFKKNLDAAIEWYLLAAKQGLKVAQSTLAYLYGSGKLGDINEEKAKYWGKMADNNKKRQLSNMDWQISEPLPERPAKNFLSLNEVKNYFLADQDTLVTGKIIENLPIMVGDYAWEAKKTGQLSIEVNAIYFVLDNSEAWWLCEEAKTRNIGWVPSNHLKLFNPSSAANKLYSSASLPLIPAETITIEKKLGQGGFGIVEKGLWQRKEVAIKKAFFADRSTQGALEKEMKIMGRFQHPNIVGFLGYINNEQGFGLVMEYMNAGTLFEHLGGRKPEAQHLFLSFVTACKLAIDTVKGLLFLHHMACVHRDLKSCNILLQRLITYQGSKEITTLVAKIADFGLSSFSYNKTTHSLKTVLSNEQMGTTEYMAPELLDVKNRCFKYGRKTDIFSLAIILLELISHKRPYEKFADLLEDSFFIYTNRIAEYVKGGERDDIPPDTHEAWKKLIEDCWAQDPNNRPEADEILKRLEKIYASLNQESSLVRGCSAYSLNDRRQAPLVKASTNRFSFLAGVGLSQSAPTSTNFLIPVENTKLKEKEKEESGENEKRVFDLK